MHIHRIIGSIIGTTIPTLCRVSLLITNNEKKQKETASLAGDRLAISIKKKCTIEQQENGMEICKLKLKELSTCSDFEASPSVKRFSLGERNPMECHTSKKILLMGETGAGKTTMINAMINYVLGVEWNDDFRFKLVDEKIRGGSQAHSQTQVVTAYDIHHQEGFRIPFSLTIVDTPGFDSTDGLDFDKEIPKAIEKFFHDENGIRVSHLIEILILLISTNEN
jgi:GTP-binding protein EngB required for normal cell division